MILSHGLSRISSEVRILITAPYRLKTNRTRMLVVIARLEVCGPPIRDS